MSTRIARINLAAVILLAAFAGPESHAAEEPITVVQDYKSALDRITQELIFRLEKKPVLLIWCFDESESMKDDQQEVKERLVRVYDELKLLEGLADNALLSAVTSYGANFHVETAKPTADVGQLRKAIDRVPIDNTGKELMCSAVGRAVMLGRKLTQEDDRQIMIIVVTDESGDPADNQTNLEPAIAAAKANHCPVYFLAREATFGYPFGYFRWTHPQTRRVHWLQIDRGPETAFVQTLQTDGFGPRRDSFASAFGSYTQMRLVWETRGVFFMLPSVEAGLSPSGARPLQIEAMRHYRPDWRSREEIIADRDRNPLRSQLWKVIEELNPHNPERTMTVSLRTTFSPSSDQLQQQVKMEGKKITAYLAQLAAAEKSLIALRDRRAAEKSRRWQANYDLTQAQLVAYQARVQAYRGCLDAFVEKPKSAPPTRKPNLQLESWNIVHVRANKVPESMELAERAVPLLHAVIENHPDTPWARKAGWELKRGFGVTLFPHFARPYVQVPNPIPTPKL